MPGGGAALRPGPVPRWMLSAALSPISSTTATATAASASTAASEIECRMRNGSRLRARAGSVRITAVASPVELPCRAASIASVSSRSPISDGTST